MTYTINENAVDIWVRDNADTMDLSVQTDASSVYLDNGKTLEHELGNGSMVSNIATVDSGMEKVIDGTYDGTYESCKMYGKSLVNVMTKVIDATWNLNLTNWSIETTSPSDLILKPNTMYSVIVYVTEKTCPDRDDLFWVGDVDGNKNKITHDIVRKNVTLGANVFVINTVSDFSNLSSNKGGINFQGSKFVEGTLKWKAIVLEGDWTDKEVPPYFTGLCDVKMPILQNIGKNLFHSKLMMGAIKNSHPIGTHFSELFKESDIRCYSQLIKVKPSSKINIILRNTTQNYAIYQYDINKCWIKGQPWQTDNQQLVLGNNTEYINIYFRNSDDSVCDIALFKDSVYIELGDELATYEPYKTSILTTSEKVILRKAGDVCDSYDALTGEYVQRVGVGVFDGSDDEGWNLLDSNDSYATFVTYTSLPNIKDNKDSICDKLPVQNGMSPEDGEYHAVQSFGSYINVSLSKASDVDTFKNWLAQEPITIYYPLATPITTTIEPSTIPFVYENGHIILESGSEEQSLLPTLEYSTVINRTGQIQSIANTVQKQEKQITKLEQMLIQNIVNLDYNNTLLTLNLEINEVI